MIYLFDKDEKLIKIVRKSAVKTALQKYALTTERYVSDRLTVELKGLNADELEQVEYMAIQTMEDAHTFHYFYVAQKFSDELTTLIGVQSGIEELRKSPVFDKRPKNALARDVITDLLAGTNWQARFVGETTPHSTNFYYTSIFDALKKVCEVWDLEMQFFVEMNGNRIGARYIDFKQRIGEAVGKRVVYGHNALQILQEVERTNIFTALVGRGKGEEIGDGYGRKITFENVVWSRTQGKPVDKPAGQKYLELPLMTRQYGIKNADGSMRPKVGFVDFSEEENPEVLIERTYKALVDAARPQLTLKTSSVYLKGVKVGDTIRVVRHDKKLDYDTRVFEITFNRLNNQSSDIKLGDRIGESNEAKFQTIADKAVEQFVNNEFSNFVQNLPDYLPSADGFNNNWYGTEDPTVKYPGKVLINDIWYKPDPEHEGHKIMLRWTGEVWEEILRTYDSEALRDRIAEEIAQVNSSMQAQSEEHDRQVADILSKTQSIETLANQAKSDAASAIARANQVKNEAIADARAQVATVNQALNTAKSELQTAIASADQKARDSQASATALRNDLNLQANKILAQAQAQTALTNRVTTVETLADGTRSTVTELSKTVNKATGDIASVTSRTKSVEDTLSQTRTQYEALTQTVNAQTGQIESISRRTGTIETGLAGVREKFENLRIEDNLLLNSSFNENLDQWQGNGVTIVDGKARIIGEFNKTKSIYQSIKSQTANDDINQVYIASISVKVTNFAAGAKNPYLAIYIDGRKNDSANTWFGSTYLTTNRLETINNRGIVQFTTTFKVNVPRSQIGTLDFHIYTRDFTGEVEFEKVSLRRGNIDLGWQASPEDLRHEIATYVRNASENSAELSRQIQLVDGKAVDAKTYAQQTADAIKTRLESLEIYKNAEGDRAEQYLTASREETARQLTAERTAIATNYVAKSTYDENVRGTTLKLNDIKTTADTAKQNLATYQNTVDRKLTELTSTTQTLDGKINTASAKITQNANEISKRLTSTQVDKAITDKGYQTKSDVDNNITGRGYITNSALQPYALSTTVQNLVQETAGSFERQITETRGLIPTEVNQNLFDVVFSDLRATGGASFVQSDDGWIEVTIKNRWSGFHWYYSDDINPSKKQYVVSYEAYLVDTVAETARLESDFGSPDQLTLINKTPKRYTVVLNRPVNIFNYINFVCDSSETGKKFRIRNIKLEEGIVATPYIAPFPTTVLFNTVKDTVDAHKRLIGDGSSISQAIQSASKFERSITSGGDIYQAIETANGLVTEVTGEGGLKTQVSTLAGSYAIKNLTSSGKVLNQLNLNKDGSVKIDGSLVQITGKTYIENGVIKEAMIGKGQIGTAHIGEIDAGIAKIINLDVSNIKGLDAEFIKAKIENAFIEWMKGKTITAQNEAMTIGLNDAFIRFKDNAKIEFQSENNTLYRTKNGTSAFIHFRDDSYNGVYTAMGVNADNTGTQNDYSSGSFAGVRVIRSNPSRYSGTTVDQVQLVGDEIRIRHGYGYENDYLVIKWDNQGKIDLIKFLRSVASRLGLPLT
ncbi:phage tail protein [Streptococcus suis]|uniref:phage tail spike protein n=1 Tax=Streptococcus suis TaxID=1307 RepID=UPI001C9CEEE1|nr:phage tail spike protein [Streptococcus suis]QZS51783.1 phage tail protein [Streptococcus suis]HEM3521398.1 phage tail protein [Streptococcus suis]